MLPFKCEPTAQLSDDQQHVADLIKSGLSVFFTGKAGTGKSFVLRHVIDMLPKDTTYVTATTGVAAVNIGGTTIHSFAGIGLGEGNPFELLRMAYRRKSNWEKCKTLVIDEISLLPAHLFEALEFIARRMKKSSKPFGGIQLILCGDFAQLPPAKKRIFAQTIQNQNQKENEKEKENEKQKEEQEVLMLFESVQFKKCVHQFVELTTIFRQKEPEFIEFLNEIRNGNLSAKSIELLHFLKRPLDTSDGIVATHLFCHKKDVEEKNLEYLNALPGKARPFFAQDKGDAASKAKLNTQLMAPPKLELKQGSQVMMIMNHPTNKKLVNGTLGVVLSFQKDEPYLPVVKFKGLDEPFVVKRHAWDIKNGNKKVIASRRQVPLILGWSMTIHKAQGKTLEKVQLKLDDAFDDGQVYVAISRCTSLSGLCISSFNLAKITTNQKVIDFYANMKSMSTNLITQFFPQDEKEKEKQSEKQKEKEKEKEREKEQQKQKQIEKQKEEKEQQKKTKEKEKQERHQTERVESNFFQNSKDASMEKEKEKERENVHEMKKEIEQGTKESGGLRMDLNFFDKFVFNPSSSSPASSSFSTSASFSTLASNNNKRRFEAKKPSLFLPSNKRSRTSNL